MYGLVNAAIQEMVCTRFGTETWDRIKAIAKVELVAFNRMAPYPDDITYRLVGAASEVLKMPPDDVIRAFGSFWVQYTGRNGYGPLFQITGHTLRDFLFNLDNLHTRVGQNFSELQPPSFVCEELSHDTLLVHYHSDRQGLCPMIFGLVEGLGEIFKTTVHISHPRCRRDGADHCEFILQYSEMPKDAAP